MNRAAAILLVSLAACGSGDSMPLFGGFTPATGAAVILAPSNCTNIAALGPTALSGILFELVSGGGDACNILTKAKQCGAGSGSTTVLAGALSGVVGGSTVAPVGPGTYSFLANPPTGAFKASISSAAQVDANCTATGNLPQQLGGSITISSVSASRVTGAMDVHFDNGQVYAAPFDLALCPVSIDVCSLFSFCGTHTCVPP
jgi:hypothetical protein